MPTNFEFKARAANIIDLEERFRQLRPEYRGEDRQVDTYFHVPEGRLKLRQGNIENALIFYRREDIRGAKQSDISLYPAPEADRLKLVLQQALGVRAVVDKKRRIYFIGNIKFHFDDVAGLGHFIEVEAIDSDGSISIEKLKEQCKQYADFFALRREDFVEQSYGEMVREVAFRR